MDNVLENKQKKLERFGYGLIEVCELCGNEYPIHKYDIYKERIYDNYIEYNGKQWLCLRCK